MTKVIGVRFRTAGKIYFFDPLNYEIKRGDSVIVETARGIEFGTVMAGVQEVEDEKVVQPLKPVLRIANERDREQEANNKVKEKEAFQICLEKIRKHELDMKLIDAEYTFDNNKVLFYFTADGRIDFRELVKDLASVFKTRIELRQIGVRDETKIVGGIGICGRSLCCHSYLADFIPVSIKMAKEQNLSLNPTKISGVCGRLMCCLKNEEETYAELNRKLPGVGDYVTTADGLKGEVQSVNVLRQLVKIIVEKGDEKEIREYPVEQLYFRRRHGRRDKLELSREELRELEKLEREEQQLSEGVEQEEAVSRPASRNREGRNRPEGEHSYEEKNRPEGERSPEGRNRQAGEYRSERRNRQEGENRSERRSRQESEFRNERRNRPENERSYERRTRQESERSLERRSRQESEYRVERRNRREGEYRNERRNRRESERSHERRNYQPEQGAEEQRRESRNHHRNRRGRQQEE